MQVNETKAEGLKREFAIAVPGAEIEESVTNRLKELARTAHLPGFRPGKAPVSLLRKKYGSAVIGEVLESTLNEASKKIMAERDLRPAVRPKIEITKFEEGSDLEYTMAIEVLPKIEPLDASRITLERLVADPEETEIEKVLARLAEANTTSKPVVGDRRSKNGDVLVIDFAGKLDGVEFPGGKADGYSLELGSGSFIPGFEDQLVGAKAGDHVTVKVSFPEKYQAAGLAGKDAVFEVDVKELRETAPAQVDEELAKALGVKSLDVLKENIREEHRKEFREHSRRRLKRSLLDALSDDHDFEVPESLLEGEFESIWDQFEKFRKSSPQEFENEDKSKSDDDYKAEFRVIAERRVRLALLMADVGRLNNIKVNPEDVRKAMMAEAKRFPGQEKSIVEYFEKTPGAREGLSATVHEDKVVDFIIEMAKVTDKKVSVEELMKEPDEAEASKAKGEAKKKGKKAAKK
ncbi:MAG: trigger factor [Rhodospirillales bacterium RIFCSPLOWO2_12_FULL_58_28]|nr:MAG: trigger factor [Rhodospirillales bacterium RIFCSPLOWO2_02_FULL_58_16]OHC79106.1 MAG: trigger factor [Rhodospirillales bacterium RIFCSPLOWO2_12_FULL_58_28]